MKGDKMATKKEIKRLEKLKKAYDEAYKAFLIVSSYSAYSGTDEERYVVKEYNNAKKAYEDTKKAYEMARLKKEYENAAKRLKAYDGAAKEYYDILFAYHEAYKRYHNAMYENNR
jgi:hypothetical protein